MRGTTHILVRIALAGLFTLALVGKLRAPETLLDPLRAGLGLTEAAAAAAFLLVIAALAACIAALLLRRGRAGLALSAAFFVTGAAYAAILNHRGWTGSCVCGVAPVAESANPMITHAYQNTACAVLCLFLAIRARPGGGSQDEEALQKT